MRAALKLTLAWLHELIICSMCLHYCFHARDPCEDIIVSIPVTLWRGSAINGQLASPCGEDLNCGAAGRLEGNASAILIMIVLKL